jgi:hypothetical protein
MKRVAAVVVSAAVALACSSTNASGVAAGADGGGSSGTPKADAYAQCKQDHFGKILNQCDLSSDCQGLTCFALNGDLEPSRCVTADCNTNADCTSHYGSLCPGATFTCVKADWGQYQQSMCVLVDPNAAPANGDAGSSGSSGSSSGAVGDAGCTPNALACGTDASGVEYPCTAANTVCCYTLGPGGSMTCGAVSKCVAASAANGASDRCPSGQYQLCKTSDECGAGYHCSAAAEGYCVPG